MKVVSLQRHKMANLVRANSTFLNTLALILSYWLSTSPVRLDSETPDTLDLVFGEIFAELEEQDISCKDRDSRALAPLVFHRRLMHPRIFMCEFASSEIRPVAIKSNGQRLRTPGSPARILLRPTRRHEPSLGIWLTSDCNMP